MAENGSTAYELAEASSDIDVAEQQRKRLAMDAKMQAKLEARTAEVQAARAARVEACDPSQNVGNFNSDFNRRRDAVRNSLAAVEVAARDLARHELGSRLDALLAEVQAMQHTLASASLFLPPYDVRAATATLTKLRADIQAGRSEWAPRKKFSFGKKKKKKPEPEQKQLASDSSSAPTSTRRAAEDFAASCVERSVEGRCGELVQVSPGELVSGQDLRLADLVDCDVVLRDRMGAVRFVGLTRCTIYSGPVAGSCFFEGCRDCVFVVASRQIRIHDSVGCDFYLYAISRPIIEHCSCLRFAPYKLSYAELEEQMAASGLNKDANLWDQVDDFRWLKAQASPNWCIIPEGERCAEVRPRAASLVSI